MSLKWVGLRIRIRLGWKVERIDKATGRPKGYADPQGTGHGKYPHINIRHPDGKQARIDIIGK